MSLLQQLEELQSQNRIHIFTGEKQQTYLYDAFSQNLFPIKKAFAEYLMNGTKRFCSKEEEKEIQKIVEHFSKWKGNIKYREFLRTVKKEVPEPHSAHAK